MSPGKLAKNRSAGRHRSNLAVTDLATLALPLPALLPSFTNGQDDGSSTPSEAQTPRSQHPWFGGHLQTGETHGGEQEAAAQPPQQPVHAQAVEQQGEAPQAEQPASSSAASQQPAAAKPAAAADAGGTAAAAQQAQEGAPAAAAPAMKVGELAPPPPHPGPPGWGPESTPRHLHGAERADTELAGIMHDVMHAIYKEMMVSAHTVL